MQQDGIYMTLGEQPGLRADKLNMVQARMLMNSSIPHHLRLLLKEIDLNITLEYAVSRKKMLSHLLKGERLSMTTFLGLLLQIARGMEDGRLYMLRAEQYALHEDYIFIDGSLQNGKVYLTYIPLENAESAVRPGEGFKSLIMVLMMSITELTGNGVQRILQYCGEDGFTPAGFRELLAELMTEGDSVLPLTDPTIIVEQPVAGKLPHEQVSELPTREAAAPVRKNTVQDERGSASLRHNPTPWMSGYPSLGLKEEQRPVSSMGDEVDFKQQSSSSRTYIVLACLLGDALLWKFLYLNSPKLLWLVVCEVVTLTLAVLSWLVWSGRIRLGISEDEEDMEEEAADIGSNMIRKELVRDLSRNPVTSVHPAAPMRDVREALKPSNIVESPQISSFGGSQKDTNSYGVKAPIPIAATALLPREQVPDKEQEIERMKRNIPYLERCDAESGGNAEKIELNRPSFIIGRSAEVAQYVEVSEGASRVHAEISRSPEGYIIKDLDSRNGTFFQGEAMIPYKEYPLTEGAAFMIVKGKYTFRTA
ncbi:FHA domain-containing protein [Paenibacillus sp. LC-T2]|uniref:FHA domain-containing protein n=2 Tax=Paenibacillus monticola TaxID=2666075 RepID=A0A7X2H1F2_9BACL|nr:FHA domain-containing protein [Paenibacillus monticola]